MALWGPHLRVRLNSELPLGQGEQNYLCVHSRLWTLPILLGIRKGPKLHTDARPGLPPRVAVVGTLSIALTG